MIGHWWIQRFISSESFPLCYSILTEAEPGCQPLLFSVRIKITYSQLILPSGATSGLYHDKIYQVNTRHILSKHKMKLNTQHFFSTHLKMWKGYFSGQRFVQYVYVFIKVFEADRLYIYFFISIIVDLVLIFQFIVKYYLPLRTDMYIVYLHTRPLIDLGWC